MFLSVDEDTNKWQTGVEMFLSVGEDTNR